MVKIDNFGTFSITLRGNAADAPDVLGKTHIKSARIIYIPSRRLKKN